MSRNILLIEDTPALARDLTEILEMEGHAVVHAGHGALALEALKTFTPDLIITDLVMPEMDGITFVRRVRRLDRGNAVPIIILSAKTDEVTMRESERAGASLFLKKPCDVDILIQSVEKLLSS